MIHSLVHEPAGAERSEGPDRAGYALSPGDGRVLQTLGGLMTVKTAGDHTRDGFAVIERVLPPGFRSALHCHDREDEAVYVLGGLLGVICDAQSWELRPGAFAFLPSGVPHHFTALGSEPTRFLVIVSPAGFEQFVTEIGQPADASEAPSGAMIDTNRLRVIAAKYQIRVYDDPDEG